MSYPCTIYFRPDGRQRQVTVTNINSDDADWFREHSAKLSMEDTGNNYVIYADVGVTESDGITPQEAIAVVDRSANPHESFRTLRLRAEALVLAQNEKELSNG